MISILEGLLKGLILWLYGLILDGVQYMANALLDVFNMDLTYFETYAPASAAIVNIILATGWALLIGNLVFQATKVMASGLGFEGEDPQILFTRTFVFSFLLLASRQICEIGLSMTSIVIDFLQIPDNVVIATPDENTFGFDGSWILVVIVGLILIYQVIKFFFEIGERYVITAVLTILAPLAFGMGGSKNTEDIFKGWARMYGSMCVMMLMNTVFLKLLLSAMSTVPSGLGVFPWLIFVVAIARVARKVDDIVCRIGLNPARTGDPLGPSLPMMLTMMASRNIERRVGNNQKEKTKPNPPTASGGTAGRNPARPGPTGPTGNSGGSSSNPQRPGYGEGSNHTASQTSTQTVGSAGQNAAASAAGMGMAAGAQTAQSSGQAGSQQAATRGRTHPPGTPVPSDKRQSTQAKKPVNIDVEYSEPSGGAQSGGVTPPHGAAANPTVSSSQEKAAQTRPTRPPVQHSSSGRSAQVPRAAGTSASHSTQNTQQNNQSAMSSSSQSQTAQTADRADRPVTPHQATDAGGVVTNNVSGTNAASAKTTAKPVQPPISGAQGAGINRGANPSSTARPPIGHNATVNNVSQESRSPSPSRNPTPPATASTGRDSVTQGGQTEVHVPPPSLGRNGASGPQKPASSPQGTEKSTNPVPSPSRDSAPRVAPPSGGRNTTVQSPPSVEQASPPSPGRNGAPAPQKPLPPTQSTDRGTGSAPSLGRNSAPQGAAPSSGRNEPPKRPPIGHDRKPPQGG